MLSEFECPHDDLSTRESVAGHCEEPCKGVVFVSVINEG
jgi:hypothetical protein